MVLDEVKASDFIEEVLKSKPKFIQNDDFMDKLYEKLVKESKSEKRETYKVLQISDWHLDPRYKEGANRNCRNSICC